MNARTEPWPRADEVAQWWADRAMPPASQDRMAEIYAATTADEAIAAINRAAKETAVNARSDLFVGEFPGMPAADYHAIDAMSNSALSMMARSPAHWWANYRAEDRPERTTTAAMKAGTLAHCAVLEPGELSTRYLVKPADIDMRTNAGKAWAAAVPSGVEVITADQMMTADAQRRAVLAVPELADILASGRAETSVFWIDSATGLYCKARPDWVHTLADGRDIILDLKTTADCSPVEFSRSVAKWGYHRQDAHYSAGWKAATGRDVAAFIFAAVSGEYPAMAAAYQLDDETRAQGAEEVAELLELHALCQRTNHWPGVAEGVTLLSLPAWARRSVETEIAYV